MTVIGQNILSMKEVTFKDKINVKHKAKKVDYLFKQKCIGQILKGQEIFFSK